MPFNDKYDGIVVEKRLNEESARTREDDAFSIFINDTEAWLSIAAARDTIDDDEMPDFHTFWKEKENVRSIREARGTLQNLYFTIFYLSKFLANITENIYLKIFHVARIMLKYMDKTANPCQDFYQYACGNWAKRNPIPKDKAGYDTFEMLRESLDSVLRELLEDPIPSELGADDATVKAKYLFQSCMNNGR